jgi:RNA polymerase sigma-70 factor, ECF subfamily
VIRIVNTNSPDEIVRKSVASLTHSAGADKRELNQGELSSWDSAARIEELREDHGFLAAFVNARLPMEVRRQVGASDVLQSVLFCAGQNMRTFQGTSEREFIAWIFEIARNRITDGIRRYRAYQRKLAHCAENSELRGWNSVTSETPSRRLSLEEDAAALIKAIDLLPEDMRQLVLLRYSRGLTFEQIGQELRIPVTTCRRRWLGACRMLQSQLSCFVS